jgi:branched chain amino acid efflux pump
VGHLAGGGVSTATQARASVATRASRDAIPVVLAYAPFGLALGATLAATHIPSLIAWSSSPLVFGGAAQLGAYLLIDPVYALAVNRFQGPDSGTARDRLRYYLAVGLILWTASMALTAAGMLLGGVLPTSLPLDRIAPLTFLLLLLPMLTSRPAYAAAATGGFITWSGPGLVPQVQHPPT